MAETTSSTPSTAGPVETGVVDIAAATVELVDQARLTDVAFRLRDRGGLDLMLRKLSRAVARLEAAERDAVESSAARHSNRAGQARDCVARSGDDRGSVREQDTVGRPNQRLTLVC